MENTIPSHELHYTAEGIVLRGVKEVGEFSEREASLTLQATSLKIRGSNLKVKEVDLDKGIVKITGSLSAVEYGKGSSGESLIKKLFK